MKQLVDLICERLSKVLPAGKINVLNHTGAARNQILPPCCLATTISHNGHDVNSPTMTGMCVASGRVNTARALQNKRPADSLTGGPPRLCKLGIQPPTVPSEIEPKFTFCSITKQASACTEHVGAAPKEIVFGFLCTNDASRYYRRCNLTSISRSQTQSYQGRKLTTNYMLALCDLTAVGSRRR